MRSMQQNVRFSSYFRSEFHFREEIKRRNPFSVFTSVSESIELGISLLVRVTEMLFFLWPERLRLLSKHLILTVKPNRKTVKRW